LAQHHLIVATGGDINVADAAKVTEIFASGKDSGQQQPEKISGL